MRWAILGVLLAGLSWPAPAQQDQPQTPPVTTPPPSSQAPAEPSTPVGGQQPPATGTPPSSSKTKKKAKKRTRTTPRKHKNSRKHKKAQPKKQGETTGDPGPRRIVVRRGGTSDTGGQLEPGLPSRDAQRQQQRTEELLQVTSANLKSVAGRSLNTQQQDMIRQITLYMGQSHAAQKEGDLERAHNLAMKARMLSDELVRQ